MPGTIRPSDLSYKTRLHSEPVAVEADQLSRVLGANWQRRGFGQLADRARGLEQAAGFIRTLTDYMARTESWTAGEALDRLAAATREASRHSDPSPV
jgi:hypothetical protein